MDALIHSTLELPPDPSQQFVERWGGYVIAFNFCFALTLILLFTQVTRSQIQIRNEEPIRVALVPTPEPALPPEPVPTHEAVSPPINPSPAINAPVQTTTSNVETEMDSDADDSGDSLAADEAQPALPMSSQFVGAVQTFGSDSEDAEVAEKESAEQQKPKELDLIDPPEPQPEPVEADDPSNPTSEVVPMDLQPPDKSEEMVQQEMEFLAELESRKQALKNYNRDVASNGSDEVADRLQAASLAQQGKKWLTKTDGLREGLIRSLDTSDVPPDVAEQVLERYGIKIMMKMMDGESGGYNFLNQAKTKGGTYYNRVGKGMYQVFSFGQPAVARMMQLEVDELKRRGYDPAKTRVTEVEFGIIQTTGGYDLGIKKIEMLPVEVAPAIEAQ